MNSYQFLQATVQSDINDTNGICQDVQQANNNKYYLKVKYIVACLNGSKSDTSNISSSFPETVD